MLQTKKRPAVNQFPSLISFQYLDWHRRTRPPPSFWLDISWSHTESLSEDQSWNVNWSFIYFTAVMSQMFSVRRTWTVSQAFKPAVLMHQSSSSRQQVLIDRLLHAAGSGQCSFLSGRLVGGTLTAHFCFQCRPVVLCSAVTVDHENTACLWTRRVWAELPPVLRRRMRVQWLDGSQTELPLVSSFCHFRFYCLPDFSWMWARRTFHWSLNESRTFIWPVLKWFLNKCSWTLV